MNVFGFKVNQIILPAMVLLALIIASPVGAQYEIYRTNLHVHTDVSGSDHNLARTPLNTVKREYAVELDALGLSDHAGAITSEEWSYLGWVSDETQRDTSAYVTGIRGFEWTYCGTPLVESTYDHANVFGSQDYWEANSANPVSSELAILYARLAEQLAEGGAFDGCPPVAQFNHVWMGTHFNSFAYNEAADDVIQLIELGGLATHTCPADNEGHFRTALQNGWHVAPTIGVDNTSVLDGDARQRHTGVWASSGSRASVLHALHDRRVFASEDKDFELTFRCEVNDESWCEMGQVIPAGGSDFKFWVIAHDPNDSLSMPEDYFASIDLMCSGQASPVYSWGSRDSTVFTGDCPFSYQQIRTMPMTSRGETALYLRIRQTGLAGLGRDYIYSAPMWIHHYTPAPGTITTNITWRASGSPYVVNWLTIPAGTQLTIEPGTVVKFTGRLNVNGRLVAQGTSAAPIYFTSIRDDSIGGDTNGDGNATTSAPGDWGGIAVGGSGADCILDHCIVSYGGSTSGYGWDGPWANLMCLTGASLDVTNSTITQSGYEGVYCNGGSVMIADSAVSHSYYGVDISSCTSPHLERCSISNNSRTGVSINSCGFPSVNSCTISNNSGDGLYVLNSPSPTLNSNSFINNTGSAVNLYGNPIGVLTADGNTASGNHGNGLFIGGALGSDNQWHPTSDFPYVAGITVDAGNTLTLLPGTVVKFTGRLNVNGRLVAQGTSAAPIYFTSIRDDSIGGDTNGDGNATTSAPGDWGGIAVGGSGADCILDHCIVSYGGSTSGYGWDGPWANLMCLTGASLDVTNSTITQSGYEGVYCAMGTTIRNSIIAHNSPYGMYLTGASSRVLYCALWANSSNYYGSPDLTGTIFADPLFVNSAAGDYHLQAGSPCIDAGDPTMFDPDGTRSDMGALPYVNPIPLVTVAGSRAKADADAIRVKSAIVTAVFSDCFYVEADDRSSGMRVDMLGHTLAVGMRADVSGTMRTSSWGERYIEATTAVQSAPPGGTGDVDPLFLRVGNIGGRNWSYDPDTGSGQMGVKDGFGLNNIGLLISTAGWVTHSPTGSYFVISDGSDMADLSGYAGVRVAIPTGLVKPAVGQRVKVTGISSIFKSGEYYYPLIRVRTQSDILVVE